MTSLRLRPANPVRSDGREPTSSAQLNGHHSTRSSGAGPLSQVLSTFDLGVRSVAEIVAATGLNPDVVSAALDHLIARGSVVAKPLASGCPADACGGCALLTRGCGAAVRSASSRARSLAVSGQRRGD
ncbi:MAG: hypothetical protein LBV06_02140 [Propionibacteriaceae bacterium]|jgi:hypothetical protein|nr:hypothetical protein [Propionibacteriaceae bacterium]